MSTIRVTRPVSGQKEARKAEFDYDFGLNLKEAVDKHGEVAVYDCFLRQAIQDVTKEACRVMQGGVRGTHRMSDAQIVAHMKRFKLGTDMVKLTQTVRAALRLPADLGRLVLDRLGLTLEDASLLLTTAPGNDSSPDSDAESPKRATPKAPKQASASG